MGPPGGIFSITLNNDRILVKRVSKSKGSLGLLPGIKVIRLFPTQPVGKRSPNVCAYVSPSLSER
jgi:hypothetical protein